MEMEEKNEKLNAKKEKAIMCLLSEPTVRKAAESAGVGETTLFRWLQEEEFKEVYKKARKQALNQTISSLQQTTSNAVQTLREIMVDEESPASSRVTAARTVLEMAFKGHEIYDLAESLDEMKRILEQQGTS